METLTTKRQHPGDKKQTLANKRRRPTAAAGPGCWLIVNSRIDAEGSASVGDAKTRAASWASSGKPFCVSFGVAPPPACCSLHLHWLGGDGGDGNSSKSADRRDVRVIAGHDDALLIQMWVPADTLDYFLYQAGGAHPSVSLLPWCNIPVQPGYTNHRDPTPRFRHLSMGNTGILRRRGDLVVVCQLEMTCDPPIYDTAELCVLRIGGGGDLGWINRRLPIVEHREGSGGSKLLQPWRMRHFIPLAAVPVGDRFLCWVDYNSGFMLCDMEETTPKLLRYVPLPPVTDVCEWWPHGRTLGAAGPDAVRFVSVGPSMMSSFNVTTWTMTLSTEEATAWVKDYDDVVLDCEEMIGDPNSPRDKQQQLLVEYPMVSSDDPDVICFKVGAMAAAINVRTKKLLPVVPSGIHQDKDDYEPPRLITAKLHWYSNVEHGI